MAFFGIPESFPKLTFFVRFWDARYLHFSFKKTRHSMYIRYIALLRQLVCHGRNFKGVLSTEFLH